MSVKDDDLFAEVSDAVGSVKLGPDPKDIDPEAPVAVIDVTEEKPAAPVAGEEEPSKGEPAEADADSAETDDMSAQREEYQRLTGVSLDGVPDDLAQGILDQFKQQEGYIQKLQARLSAEPEKPAAPEPEEGDISVEDISDEDLLKAAGYDPEDFEVQNMARFILPGLRRELALEDKVEALSRESAVSQTQARWNGSLDKLEGEYGKLPFTREQVLRYAIEEQIADPEVVYFRLTAPVRKEAEALVADARRAAAKRIESGGLKPRSVDAGPPVVTEEMTLHEAVEAAAKAAAKESGKSWKDIFKGRDS